jgi:hypothetical protein
VETGSREHASAGSKIRQIAPNRLQFALKRVQHLLAFLIAAENYSNVHTQIGSIQKRKTDSYQQSAH